jgi:Flp pilus assembly protein TadD
MDLDNFMHHSTILAPARRFGLVLVVCVGLLTVLPEIQAGPQADTSPGAEAAEQAYREVSGKNYAGAIQDFRKALAANPSNAIWRKDLGFACLAAGLPEDAAAEFSRVYSEHPEDFGLALQLGYLSVQLHREEDARKYFEQASRSADPGLSATALKELSDLQASQLRDRKQKGYDLIVQHRSNEAIKVFEGVHRDDPSDASATLQLGYLYAAAGRMGEAREMFAAAGKNADPKIVAQVNAGLEVVRRETKLWFASFYAAPFYQSRFSNEINTAAVKIGLSPSRYFQPYAGLRFSRDVRSQAGTLPQIYSDNSAIISIGVQSTLVNTGIVLYAEAGTAVNLIGEGPQAASDYRVGGMWFKPWGTDLFAAGSGGHSVSLTGSAYADAGFYSRYDHNFIGSAQLREGISLPTGRALPMQLLAAINLVMDSNGNFYNNIVEVGPVLRIAPFRHLPSLTLEAQYLRGFYTRHDPSNPYGPRYGDFRVFLVWSKTF